MRQHARNRIIMPRPQQVLALAHQNRRLDRRIHWRRRQRNLLHLKKLGCVVACLMDMATLPVWRRSARATWPLGYTPDGEGYYSRPAQTRTAPGRIGPFLLLWPIGNAISRLYGP